MKKEKYCTQCGKSNRATAKICIECGQPFKSTPAITIDEQACPECGVISRADAKFCRQCGYRFVPVAPPIAPEPPLVQRAASGVVVPPVAELPLLPDDVPEMPDLPERLGGKTGILLTQEELELLRKAKPDQPIFVKNPNKKKSR